MAWRGVAPVPERRCLLAHPSTAWAPGLGAADVWRPRRIAGRESWAVYLLVVSLLFLLFLSSFSTDSDPLMQCLKGSLETADPTKQELARNEAIPCLQSATTLLSFSRRR